MKKMYFLCRTILVVMLCSGALAAADTLRYYNPQGLVALTGYKDYEARFELPRWGHLTALRIWTGGSGTGSFTVHLFGHEGGSQLAQLERDLITPLTVQKTQAGNQAIDVPLPDSVWFDNNQFFVMVSSLPAGVNLLADNRQPAATCTDPLGGDMYYLFVRDAQNKWWLGNRRAMAIDAVIAYAPVPAQPWFEDVTAAAGFPTDISAQRSIAAGDLNGDDFPDVVVKGRVFFNNFGSQGVATFTEKTAALGIVDSNVLANPLIDINNDGLLDILLLNQDSSKHVVYINKGNGNFDKQDITAQIPVRGISSFSIADINNDGYPDIFIGRVWTYYTSAPDLIPNFFYLNDGHDGFTDASDMIYPPGWTHRRTKATAWCDFDNDGDLDLYVSNYYLEADELWENKVNETTPGPTAFMEVAQAKGIDVNRFGTFSHGTGADWGDYDNDGNFDLLAPMLAHPPFMVQYDHLPTQLYRNSGAPGYTFQGKNAEIGIEYEETHDGAAWGDVNNDGLLDFFISTNYECRRADIYLQNADHTFTLSSPAFGLQELATQVGDWWSAGDACWFDYNGDGRPDMMAADLGRFRLYRNNVPTGNSHVHLNLRSTSANKLAIGARVEVYAGGKKYMQEVNAGRGVKIQRPATLSFGLADAPRVDSVRVRWPGKTTWETFKQIRINALNYLEEGGQVRVGLGNDKTAPEQQLRLFPNPATGSVSLQLAGYDGNAFVRIYDLRGAEVYRNNLRLHDAATIRPGVAPGNYMVILQAEDRQYTSRLTVR